LGYITLTLIISYLPAVVLLSRRVNRASQPHF
jgi:hypothetical protein